MTFELEIQGRACAVQVEPLGEAGPAGGQFRVTIRPLSGDPADEPEVVVVDGRPTDLGLSLVFEAERRVVDAAISVNAGGEYLVQLPHVDVPVLVDGRRRRGGVAAATGKGEQRVTAPMPGRILRVLVAPGDEVSARQGLVVVEAMKMENELRAVRAGRVREIAVAPGESVESGRLLIVLE